jgi:hypothetical protein
MTGSLHRALSETRVLAEKAQAEKLEARRSIRGPERFFYDRSTYTGAHWGKAGPRDEDAVDVAVDVPEPEKLSVLSLQCPMCDHTFKSRKENPKCPKCLNSVPRCEEKLKAQLVAAGQTAVDPQRKLSGMRRVPSEASTRAPSAEVGEGVWPKRSESVARMGSKEHLVEQVRTLGWWERGGERDSVLRAQAVTKDEEIPRVRKASLKPPLPSMAKLRPL